MVPVTLADEQEATASGEEATAWPAKSQERRSFLRFVGYRLASGVLVVWIALTLVFFVFRALPGSTNLTVLLGAGGRMLTHDQIAAMRADLGLDHPLVVQYLLYLRDLLHGDLGTSYLQQQPVAELVGAQIWPTAQLALVALLTAWLIAVVWTVLTAGRRSWLTSAASTLEVVVASLPQFWLALMLLVLFAVTLQWFPVADGNSVWGMVLPTLTLAIPLAGQLVQLTRASFEDALEQPFTLSARARGASDTRVRFGHALRHALAPALALSGQTIGWLLGGALIIEQVFARTGLGRVVLRAVTTRDLPLILGVIIVIAVGYVVINIVIDILQRLIDPRIVERRR